MSGIDLSNIENAASELLALSDEDLRQLKFTMPWETLEDSQASEDYDGFIGTGIGLRNKLQEACWEKFNKNPQVSTAVRGHVGRLTGMGFEASSEVPKIQDIIDEVEFDPRNRLYTHWPKFVGRSIIEGELYLCLTLHNDGFVEVDFIDPGDIQGGGEDGRAQRGSRSRLAAVARAAGALPAAQADRGRAARVDPAGGHGAGQGADGAGAGAAAALFFATARASSAAFFLAPLPIE